jgi:hypothetical protein
VWLDLGWEAYFTIRWTVDTHLTMVDAWTVVVVVKYMRLFVMDVRDQVDE